MRCGWAKRTSSPIAGPGRVHAPVLPTINGPNRLICLVRSAPNAEPAPPSCCRPATPKLCSFTSMRSQPKSLRALTLFSSSIKPGGMAPRPSRFQTTSRSCSFRHAHPNSTAKKISGNSCGRTGCRTEFSNPSTISSITAATLGTRSSISRGKSCPSPAAIGQPQVTQSEDWYNPLSSHYAPLQQLQVDLANNTVARYNWITPDQFNDSHSALANGFTYQGVHYTGDQASIAQGDNFLSIIVPQIEASQAYRNNGAIIIWWDETEGGDDPSRKLEEIVISPLAKGNAYTNNIFYTHSSDLLTMEELFGLPCVGGSCGANDLSDL